MRNKLYKIATAILALATTFTILSCSGDSGGGGNQGSIKREKISGVSQKGPFSNGASVRIYELDANLKGTNRTPIVGTTDDKGNFDIAITNGELASPYVILEVTGSYYNEVNGSPSTDPITLFAIADVSNKSNVNINVLTHLEAAKVVTLTQSGKTFAEAKNEAQKEVLAALGISGIVGKNSEDISLFGGSPSDSALLIVSILLQGNRATGKVSSLLDAISNEINSSGALSDSVKSEVANGLAGLDMDDVRDNISNLAPSAKVPSLDDIKNVIAGIDSSATVPSSSSSEPSSSSAEPSSSSAEPSSSSVTGNSSSSGSGGNDNPTALEGTWNASGGRTLIFAGNNCNYKVNGATYSFTFSTSGSTITYTASTGTGSCNFSVSGETLTISNHPESSINGTYTKSEGGDDDVCIDGSVFIGTQVWQKCNLNIVPSTGNSACYDNDPANCAKYGRLYDWATAMGIDAEYNEQEWGGSDAKHKGICPSGWHIPSDAEWTTLTNYVGSSAGTKLKASSLWNSYGIVGTDEYNFSALPGGAGDSDGGFDMVSLIGFWWSASEYGDYGAYSRSMDYYYEDVGEGFGEKYRLRSVRCLKD